MQGKVQDWAQKAVIILLPPVSSIMVALISESAPKPSVVHKSLRTTFTGVEHPLSTSSLQLHQFRGIKYAEIPARFRQSKMFTAFAPVTDATSHGPICPQLRPDTFEVDLLGELEGNLPVHSLKQSEFECLNLTITRPNGHDRHSRIPVMVWFHGGWTRGSGSSWLYDPGSFVRRSAENGQPIMVITFNYRLGLLGTAASPKLEEDNELAGDKGVGNYGLRDQQTLLRWIHHYISDFGGDSLNVTLFGETTGASDILCHLYSSANQTKHLFHRAIIQSPAVEHNVPDVRLAGSHLSRTMASLHVSSVEELRRLDVKRLITSQASPRVTDDGVFLGNGWKDFMLGDEDIHCSDRHFPASQHHALPLQPIIIGDCTYESSLWSFPVSYWTAEGIVRRVRAICQSLHKGNALLRAYDISPYTPEDELSERVLELINDARFACPIDCVAAGIKRGQGGKSVYRYVFDQESPAKGMPHHAVDLVYLFDNIPRADPATLASPSRSTTPDLIFGGSDDEGDDFSSPFDYDDSQWVTPIVDDWTYTRVRNTMQDRWIAFAYGHQPWHNDKAFVFGPEGETGERSWSIFEGRRRTSLWRSALMPLGLSLIQKLGEELSNGPVVGTKASF